MNGFIVVVAVHVRSVFLQICVFSALPLCEHNNIL